MDVKKTAMKAAYEAKGLTVSENSCANGQCNLIYIKNTVFPIIVPALEYFPPLNSFRSKNSVYLVKN